MTPEHKDPVPATPEQLQVYRVDLARRRTALDDLLSAAGSVPEKVAEHEYAQAIREETTAYAERLQTLAAVERHAQEARSTNLEIAANMLLAAARVEWADEVVLQVREALFAVPGPNVL